MQKKLSALVSVLAVGTSTIALSASGAMAQSVELIFNNTLPPFNETYQVGIRDFAQDIIEESQGDILVTIPDSELAPADRQYEAVRDGIADLAAHSCATVVFEPVSPFHVRALLALKTVAAQAPVASAALHPATPEPAPHRLAQLDCGEGVTPRATRADEARSVEETSALKHINPLLCVG